eukprot:scaffold30976_cov80-Skeletonema_marinoi.AAC.1
MPIQTVVGGLTFNTGRIVRELGDVDDLAVCVAACVSIGYDSGERGGEEIHAMHDTKDENLNWKRQAHTIESANQILIAMYENNAAIPKWTSSGHRRRCSMADS